MKKRALFGVPLLILGLLIAFGPRTLFPVCEFGHTNTEHMVMATDSPMSCHWIAQAALGEGLLIAILALFLLLFRDRAVRRGVTFALLPVGALVLLTPEVLFQACASPAATCRVHAVPALYALSVVTLVITLLTLALDRKKKF